MTPPEFIEAVTEDLEVACAIKSDSIDSLIDELRHNTSFVSGPVLREIVVKHLPSDDASDDAVAAVWRLLLGLHEIINENDLDEDQRKQFFESICDESESDESFDRQRALELLEKLVGPFEAIQRQAKAVRVAKAAGHQLSEFRFVCDLRPVFSLKDRQKIDGLIPLTTLTMESFDASGQVKRNEVVLSYRELQQLINEATVAQQKLNQMVKVAESAKVIVPDMQLTRRPDSVQEAGDE